MDTRKKPSLIERCRAWIRKATGRGKCCSQTSASPGIRAASKKVTEKVDTHTHA